MPRGTQQLQVPRVCSHYSSQRNGTVERDKLTSFLDGQS